MKLFSDCSGECCVCACGGGCLAGHGDDDFYPATKEQVIDRLDKAQYKDYKDYMIGYLAGMGYHYDVSRYGSKKDEHERQKEERDKHWNEKIAPVLKEIEASLLDRIINDKELLEELRSETQK